MAGAGGGVCVTLPLFEGRCCHLVAKGKKTLRGSLTPAPSSSFQCLRGQQPAATPQLETPPPATQKATSPGPAFPTTSGEEQEETRKRRSCGPCAGLPLGQSVDPSINSQVCASWPISPVCLRLGSAHFLLTLNLTFHAGKQLAEKEGGR